MDPIPENRDAARAWAYAATRMETQGPEKVGEAGVGV